jgi:hypothetical protein
LPEEKIKAVEKANQAHREFLYATRKLREEGGEDLKK